MPDPGTDSLSSLAHEVIKAAPYDKLVVTTTGPKAHELLDNVTPQELLTVPLKSIGHGYAMLAGLWLWQDALEESHLISQMDAAALSSARYPHAKGSKTSLNVRSVESVENDNSQTQQKLAEAANTLSFWHAIMHRREGDFSNAKYWYARCTSHPVLQTMVPFANDILHPLPADKSLLRLTRDGWDPNAFVDLVEQVHDRPTDARHAPTVALQRLEWRLLFEHCMRAASGQ